MANTSPRLRGLEILLGAVLIITVLDTAYLSWRFIALHGGWVAPGTGICSWSARVDCDRVLLRPEASAFYVPNGLLGFSFFFGCLIWWSLGSRLGEAYRHHVIRTLLFWLTVATLFTFRFFWLLIHLDVFCPFCPWNHLLTYVALVTVFLIWRRTPRPRERAPLKPLVLLVVLCVAQFFLWLALWAIAYAQGAGR
jgi:uncharacterized membrane protein